MGNYTPDQLSAALMRAADYIENADGNVCLNDGEAEHIIAALRFAATLRQQAARVDEGLRPALEKLVESASLMLSEIDTCGHEVDPAYRLHLYEAWEQGKAAIAQQGEEHGAALWVEFTDDGHHIRLWTRHEGQAREEIREGRKMQAFYSSPAALEATLSAQPAERQGERKLVAWMTEGGRVINAETRARVLADAELGGEYVVAAKAAENYCIPLYHPAAPVGVPDGWKQPAAEWLRTKAAEQRATNEKYPDHAACYPTWRAYVLRLESLADELIAAAPSAPQGEG